MAIITRADHETIGKILYNAMIKAQSENRQDTKAKINKARDILDDILCEEYEDVAGVYYNV